jgi:hypothetical protein
MAITHPSRGRLVNEAADRVHPVVEHQLRTSQTALTRAPRPLDAFATRQEQTSIVAAINLFQRPAIGLRAQKA